MGSFTENDDVDVCPECDGAGGWIDPPGSPFWIGCEHCHGSGRYTPAHTPEDDAFERWRDEKKI